MSDVADEQSLLLQLLDPANRADPYPLYAEFRDRGPVQRAEANLTVFSSYCDCDEVLRHPSSSSNLRTWTVAQRQYATGAWPRPLGPPSFMSLDPPDHTRLRRLVSKAFIPKAVNALQPNITALVHGLLDRIAEQDRFDLVGDFAHPLPVAIICRLLGVPSEDQAEVQRHVNDTVAPRPIATAAFTGELPSHFGEGMRATRWLRNYLRNLIEQRRSHPGDNLMSALIAAEESGDQLIEEEIVSTCHLLLIAGQETTVSLIANAVLAMLHRPWLWTALGSDSGRAPAIIAETLRFDPPVQMATRFAADDMTIAGVHVVKGDIMTLLLAAAHRDPAEFERPETFDPDRGAFRHLAFGGGAHCCLGVPLARLEAGVALSAVTARFPNAQLDGEPQYKPNVTLRGMSMLPVKL